MELDLGAVRAFLAVVDDGHFTDAADRLGMTQQAVSKRIARLESDLGAPLLNRSRSGARLTEDGAAFLPHARALISLADQAAGPAPGPPPRAPHRRPRPRRGPDRTGPFLLRDQRRRRSTWWCPVVPSPRRPRWPEGSVYAAFGRGRPRPAAGDRAHPPPALEPLYLLVGRGHRFARCRRVPAAQLSGLTAVDAGQRRRQRVGAPTTSSSAPSSASASTPRARSSAATTSWRGSAPQPELITFASEDPAHRQP